MATYKELGPNDIRSAKSFLNQLVDVIQEDISGSTTRRKYQIFVTGGVGPGVTSSLFHTVYDQDYSLQTSNVVLDMSVGLFQSSSTALSNSLGLDSAGKRLYPSNSLMMREKVDNYKQFAQVLLGNANNQFMSPINASTDTATAKIDEALFVGINRLFSRDSIKRETFALKFYQTSSHNKHDGLVTNRLKANLNLTSLSGSKIFTDVGSATNQITLFGGATGNIVDSSDTNRSVGNIFYDQGIVVLDLKKIISGGEHCSGVIDGMRASTYKDAAAGQVVIGPTEGQTYGNTRAKFIPDLMYSGSIDNIVDHIASTRFQSGSLTAMTFQNVTNINSTLFFCRANPDEFNYSSNPTFTDATGRIKVIDQGMEGQQRAFSFITSVGLYDANNNLLAVAKLSRPIEKNDEKDITIRVRLDF
ncbi:hypothetical protein CMI37_31310 [Candidatus Pacearchaeota archaeon]|nr:hypothetical protein [Candidatus Pacearchaeota archaeon]